MFRIKICGIVSSEDAEQSLLLGADALGFVFVDKSVRYRTATQVFEILNCIDNKLLMNKKIVALFVDSDIAFIESVLSEVPQINCLQFHGNESNAFAHSFSYDWIKAIPVSVTDTSDTLNKYIDAYPDASSWLFDTKTDSTFGGGGASF